MNRVTNAIEATTAISRDDQPVLLEFAEVSSSPASNNNSFISTSIISRLRGTRKVGDGRGEGPLLADCGVLVGLSEFPLPDDGEVVL